MRSNIRTRKRERQLRPWRFLSSSAQQTGNQGPQVPSWLGGSADSCQSWRDRRMCKPSDLISIKPLRLICKAVYRLCRFSRRCLDKVALSAEFRFIGLDFHVSVYKVIFPPDAIRRDGSAIRQLCWPFTIPMVTWTFPEALLVTWCVGGKAAILKSGSTHNSCWRRSTSLTNSREPIHLWEASKSCWRNDYVWVKKSGPPYFWHTGPKPVFPFLNSLWYNLEKSDVSIMFLFWCKSAA